MQSKEPQKVLKNKKADGIGIKTGLCPDAIQRRNRWSPKAVAKPLLNPLRGGDSTHGALKVCSLLGCEATTSFISLLRQLPGRFGGAVAFAIGAM